MLSTDQWKTEYDKDVVYFELLSDWFNSGRFKRRTEPIVAAMQSYLTPSSIVLDAGCAAGAMCVEIASKPLKRIDAVDFSSTALQFAHANAVRHGVSEKITFVESKLEALDIADGSYDVIVAADIIEHIVEPLHFLNEMWRVCRPGGVMILETPNTFFRQHRWYPAIAKLCDVLRLPKSHNLFSVESGHDFDRYHVSLLSWASMHQLIADSRWEIVQERTFGWWMQPGAADMIMHTLAMCGRVLNRPIQYYGDTDMLITMRKPQ